MLYLIGLGLWDESDMPLRGIDAIKKCDTVYCEFYTNKWTGSLHRVEEAIGRKIITLKRVDVESDKIVYEAKHSNVALLVAGDPLAATTHVQLMIDAKNAGVETKIVHASSIYASVAETGLQLYKFGRATTLVFLEKSFRPSSPYEVIVENRKAGLHTLVLLDIHEGNKYMTVKDGIEVLVELGDVLDAETKIIACCQMGGQDQCIRYGPMKELAKDTTLSGTPAVIVIPGRLHFKEEEALKMYEA